MFIIYGTNRTLIKQEDTPQVTCSNCGQTGSMIMSRYVSYCTVFWIPMFPYRMRGLSHCTSCDNMLRYKNMSSTEKEYYERFKLKTRLPWWTFIGSFITICFFSWVFLSEDKSIPTNASSEIPTILSSGDYVDGKRQGIWTLYYSDSVVMVTGYFDQNLKQGKFVSYYPTGEKMNEEYYEKGKKSGQWIYWDEEGDTSRIESYHDDELVQSKVFENK